LQAAVVVAVMVVTMVLKAVVVQEDLDMEPQQLILAVML